MEFNPYTFIIGASLTLIVSYLFTLLSQKTKIPSVLMLIVSGMLLTEGFKMAGIGEVNWMPILEVLGIVGLILIVLDASLDLKLNRNKLNMILSSMLIAFVAILINGILIAFVIKAFIPHLDFIIALIYAMPFSIISSAIVLPSINHLEENKKEFLIYESTFSDIIGIMFFYFLIEHVEATSTAAVGLSILGNISITLIISIVLSYALIMLLQRFNKGIKLVLLIAILLILYAAGKLMHFSPLLIILMFGLMLANPGAFFKKFMKRFYKPEEVKKVYAEFNLITGETAFVVRTFFFVIFGASLSVASLASTRVIILSMVSLVVIYVTRWLLLRTIQGKDIYPQVFVAPRGLISVLLFFAIPEELQLQDFEAGILLFIILFSNIIMAGSMMHNARRSNKAPLTESATALDSTLKVKQ